MNYLIIDDDQTFSKVLQRSLTRRGLTAFVAHDAQQAIDQTNNEVISRIVLDLKLGQDSGLQLLPQLLKIKPTLEVVVLTGYASVATAVEAIKQGAVNYLCKPVDSEDILAAFSDSQSENTQYKTERPLSVDRVEWEHIHKILTEHDGNISATARALGMHRRTLQRKLNKRPAKQ